MSKELVKDGGQAFSSDEYFIKNGVYVFNPSELVHAHKWNQKRVADALKTGLTPIVVDNTHTQKWEARPYVVEALKYNYKIEFVEPNTPWKKNPIELQKRNVHNVPLDAIKRMLDRWENNFTVQDVLNSKPPHR